MNKLRSRLKSATCLHMKSAVRPRMLSVTDPFKIKNLRRWFLGGLMKDRMESFTSKGLMNRWEEGEYILSADVIFKV